MAHLAQIHERFYARFRHGGKPYQKALKTTDAADAKAAMHGIEQTLHLLAIGKLVVPSGVDPGDFIVSSGTHTKPRRRLAAVPSVNQAIQEYIASQENLIAETYRSSQRTHLRHLEKFLNGKQRMPVDKLSFGELNGFVQHRLKQVEDSTVCRERNTLLRFSKWGVTEGYFDASPASGIEPIRCGRDLPPFRTKSQIEEVIERGGIKGADALREMWERLFLDPQEIGDLLRLVKRNQTQEQSYLLHAVSAYTGMRRGEVLRAEWLHVDDEGANITAFSRKQSRSQRMTSREIELHPELQQVLRACRKKNPRGQYIVGDPDTLRPLSCDLANRWFWQPMRGTEWCVDRNRNWFKVGFHSYRHSFASNMASRGVDQRIIDNFMGHTTEAMRRRYRHLYPKDRRSAIECFSFNSENGNR